MGGYENCARPAWLYWSATRLVDLEVTNRCSEASRQSEIPEENQWHGDTPFDQLRCESTPKVILDEH